MAKLDILKLYKKEDCYILFLIPDRRENLEKDYREYYLCCFFHDSHFDNTYYFTYCLFLKDLFALLSIDVNYTLF